MPRYTLVDNLHNKPITTFISEVWPRFQRLALGSRSTESYMMVHLRYFIHRDLRVLIRDPRENEDFGVWIRHVQSRCDEIRKQMCKDIALGVLELPRCCSSFRCVGARERVALLGPQHKARAEWVASVKALIRTEWW
jgi:hypothetical protein